MAAGVALVPEDRRQQGLVMELSIERNVTLPRSRALSQLGFLTGSSERRSAKEWTERLKTKYGRLPTRSARSPAATSRRSCWPSGWRRTPEVLIVDEPTRGIDVGTKAEVHRLMSSLAAEGVAVLMVSSELPEVLGMADRVLVMREGRLVAELSRARGDRGVGHVRRDGTGGGGMTRQSQTPGGRDRAHPLRRRTARPASSASSSRSRCSSR